MKIYKIVDTVTGLYSRGGEEPRFSRAGKVWKQIGHLKNHINCLRKKFKTDRYVVIEYELTPIGETPITEFISDGQ